MQKALDFFYSNPFYMLDLPAGSSRSEAVKRYEKFVKLSRIDALKDYGQEYSFPNRQVIRDQDSLQQYLHHSNDDLYRVFWVENPKSLALIIDQSRELTANMLNPWDDLDLFIVDYFSKLEKFLDKPRIDLLLAIINRVSNYENGPVTYGQYKAFEARYEKVELEERGKSLIEFIDLHRESIKLPLIKSIEELPSDSGLLKIYSDLVNDTKSSHQKLIAEIAPILASKIGKHFELSQQSLHEQFKEWEDKYDRPTQDLYTLIDKQSNLLNAYRELIVMNKASKKHSDFVVIESGFYNIVADYLHTKSALKHYDDMDQWLGFIKQNAPSQIQKKMENVLEFYRCVIKGGRYLKDHSYSLNETEVGLWSINTMTYNGVLTALSGDPMYQYMLGSNYLGNQKEPWLPKLPKSRTRAIHWIDEASDKLSNASLFLFYLYIDNDYATFDRNKAISYLKKAAGQGNAEAIQLCRKYGFYY